MQACERDLVGRDAALPGLALLLEPEATLAALRAHWPTRALADLRPTYLRYKPGVNCLAAYTLRIDGLETPLHLTAHRVGDEAKLRKVFKSSGGGAPLESAVLEPNIALRVFPHDRKLRGLKGLVKPKKLERFLAELLPQNPELWQAQLRLLRYKPERRLVARLETAAGERALLKLYGPTDFCRALAGATTFSRRPFPTAPLLGAHPKKHALAWAWLEAEPGEVALRRSPRQAEAIGQLLARLHSQPAEGLRPVSRAGEGRPLRAAAEAVAFLLPELAERVLKLAARLGSDLRAAPPLTVPVHGDFSADQVVFGCNGPQIIDLDAAALGDPAWDLGPFAAQLELETLRGAVRAETAVSVLGSFREGYLAQCGALPRRTDLYTAAGLLRLAPHAFRDRRPDWAGEMRALVSLAETLLVPA